MLWAYLSFSQLIIIWAGNLKEEIPWYQQRAFGGWAPVGVALVVLHFFVPFLLLLQRGVKRRLRVLSIVAGWIVVLTLVDIYWIVVPPGTRLRRVSISPTFLRSSELAACGSPHLRGS